MIFEVEVPEFPPRVLLERSHILDTVTGDKVPINETARLMLSLVDGRRTAKEIGEAVAAGYGIAPRRVTSDFLQLVARLNEKCLLNVKTPLRSRCAALPRIVRLFLIDGASGQVRPPWHRRRLDLRNESKRAGFLSVVRCLSPSAAVMGSALSLAMWLLLGEVLPSFWMADSIALAFAVSLVLHEAAHAMVLAPAPAFLSLYGPVFLVGHGEVPPGKGFLVSAAGPTITGAAGLLVMLMSGLLSSEHLVFAGEILSLNLLGMTTIAADGRKALRNLALVLDPSPKRGVRC
ncbi:MAG TPA: PqqD family protein [Thermoanaerobaculia bacterium]|nr:PqqD family protein [Thermoanaerobaculia bacterium]